MFFLHITQNICRQLIPENSWPFKTVSCGCPYDNKIKKISSTFSRSPLKYGSENRPWVRGFKYKKPPFYVTMVHSFCYQSRALTMHANKCFEITLLVRNAKCETTLLCNHGRVIYLSINYASYYFSLIKKNTNRYIFGKNFLL